MGRKFTMGVVAALATAMLLLGCGPKCPEIKSAMSQSKIKEDDEKRINTLVSRRKALMAQAEKGPRGLSEIETYQYAVTAYELAIQLQLKSIALGSPEGPAPAKSAILNDTRCLIDKLLNTRKAEKGDYLLGDREGEKLQQRQELLRQQFGRAGEPGESDLEYAYENGLTPPPAPPPEELEVVAEPEPAPAPEAAEAKAAPEPATPPPAKKPSAKKPVKKPLKAEKPIKKQPKTEKP